MSDFELFDFEKDMPLTDEDVRVMNENRKRRIDPAELEWEWISLAWQFPEIDQDRPTSEGWLEFEL